MVQVEAVVLKTVLLEEDKEELLPAEEQVQLLEVVEEPDRHKVAMDKMGLAVAVADRLQLVQEAVMEAQEELLSVIDLPNQITYGGHMKIGNKVEHVSLYIGGI